jgi:uncharacterized repeat protein (TIGR03803 family)
MKRETYNQTEIPAGTETRTTWNLRRLAVIAIAGTILGLQALYGWAQTETPIFSFTGNQKGENPFTHVILGGPKKNQLFGTTANGGTKGFGRIYRLAPPAAGGTVWSSSTLYNFAGPGQNDGEGPGAVVADQNGVLYGVTTGQEVCCGVIFSLTPPVKGTSVWTESILYRFQGGNDGIGNQAGLALDAAGNLYGVTVAPVGPGFGTVYRLLRPAPGSSAWTKQLLYAFQGGTDGQLPQGDLLIDANTGSVIGTTLQGGLYGLGTVYSLTPAHPGLQWPKTSIHQFQGDNNDAGDGAYPNGHLAGQLGRLFGTTQEGGVAIPCCGVAFELEQEISGNPVYTLKILAAFPSGVNGATPVDGLTLDASGNLWGTTEFGGSANSGILFRIAPRRVILDAWTFAVMHSFTGNGDGVSPQSVVAVDSAGNAYGTTLNGGTANMGTVYEFVP